MSLHFVSAISATVSFSVLRIYTSFLQKFSSFLVSAISCSSSSINPVKLTFWFGDDIELYPCITCAPADPIIEPRDLSVIKMNKIEWFKWTYGKSHAY